MGLHAKKRSSGRNAETDRKTEVQKREETIRFPAGDRPMHKLQHIGAIVSRHPEDGGRLCVCSIIRIGMKIAVVYLI